MSSQSVLVTGGAGYIGSHCVLALLEAGHDVAVLDNLSNSSAESLDRVAELTGRRAELHVVDLLDERAVREVLDSRAFDAVMHFAGLKAVGESVEQPLRYYRNNVVGAVNLLEATRSTSTRRVVFSSSCTVYGEPESLPVAEDAPLGAANPYGRTKLAVEDMLRDLAASEPGWHVALLRYFNPVGAHPSARIGEDPRGIPNNLMPFVMQVAAGRLDKLRVFGNDYPTPDGTCVRDYIHVSDLASGHLAALEALDRVDGCEAFNLGTGRGHSVLEVVDAASEAVGETIPYEFAPRRPGDVAASYADPAKARRDLGWTAQLGLRDMCADHWRWQRDNPDGYKGQ